MSKQLLLKAAALSHLIAAIDAIDPKSLGGYLNAEGQLEVYADADAANIDKAIAKNRERLVKSRDGLLAFYDRRLDYVAAYRAKKKAERAEARAAKGADTPTTTGRPQGTAKDGRAAVDAAVKRATSIPTPSGGELTVVPDEETAPAKAKKKPAKKAAASKAAPAPVAPLKAARKRK